MSDVPSSNRSLSSQLHSFKDSEEAELLTCAGEDEELRRKLKSAMKLDKNGIVCIAVLFSVNLLNYMDRYTVAGVLGDIQKHFEINDQWAGFLQTVFIIFFMVFAPLCGFLGDRFNRKILMVCGLSIWVLAVLASTFVPGHLFWVFVVLRGIVGIGEASYSIIAPTLIADYFLGKLRSRVLMFFYFAIPVGSGLGFAVGSVMASWLGSWSWGLRFTPIFGAICIAAILLFVREPERGQAEKLQKLHEAQERSSGAQVVQEISSAPDVAERTTYWEDIKYLCRIKTYLWCILGQTSVIFVTGTLAWWAPTAVMHAMAAQKGLDRMEDLLPADKNRVSIIFGGITILAGLLGVAVGTIWAQVWKSGKLCFSRCKTLRADAIVCAIGSFLAVPFLFGGLHLITKNIVAAWISIFFAVFCLCLNWAITIDMLMYIIVPQRRSIASSWLVTISHLFGDASGPYIIGLVSDWIRGSGKDSHKPGPHFHSLLMSFYIPNALLLVSGFAYVLCAITLNNDVAIFKRQMGIREIAQSASSSRRRNSSHRNKAFNPE